MPRSVEAVIVLMWIFVLFLLASILAPVAAKGQTTRYELAYGRLTRLGDGAYVVGNGLVLTPPQGATSHLRLAELKGRIVTIRVEVER